VIRRFDLNLNADADTLPANRLGDWYANLVNIGPQRWVLCLSEKSNLPVLVPALRWEFPHAFPIHLGLVLRAIGVPADVAAQECDLSSSFRFGKTLSRSTLGSLNDMASHIDHELRHRNDPVAAAAALSEMPCRIPNVIFPGEAVFELLGIAELYDRDRVRRMFNG